MCLQVGNPQRVLQDSKTSLLATRGGDVSGMGPLCTNVCLYRLATYRTPRLYCWQQGAGMGQGWGHFARMCACRLAILKHHCWQQGVERWVRDGGTLHECVPVGWQPTKSYRILRHHYWQQGARIGQGSGHFARMCACRLAILRHHCWQQGAGMGEGWGHFARMCTCRLAILRMCEVGNLQSPTGF